MSLDLGSLKKNQISADRKRSGYEEQRSIWDQLSALAHKDFKMIDAVGIKQKKVFYREIGMLLSAGIDLPTILKLSSQGAKGRKTNGVIYQDILQKLNSGSSLSAAMESTGKFNNFDCYSVLMGENTGELSNVFDKLYQYYDKRIVQKRKIQSALSYPIIVLITTFGALFFMLKFVVPMFSETLVRFGGELPPLTNFIIKLSHNISSFALGLLIVVLSLALIYRKFKANEQLQKTLTRLVLKTPYIGNIIYKTHLVQFIQSLELLLSSRVNVVDSIDLTSKIVRFYPLKKALNSILSDLNKGGTFHQSMENQNYFDPSMVTMVRIGEEINQLDKIFMQLNKQYEDELKYQSDILISILEPLLILFLAVLVAVILIAMYLPMFKIGSVIH